MYLTDYREKTLKDVITQLEPGLFQKVTGLDVKDFEMLCSIGVFNASLMNDAIFKFKRYEDSSLSYTGIEMNQGREVGGWDITIKREEYDRLFYNQQAAFNEEELKEAVQVVETPTKSEAKTAYKPEHVTRQYESSKTPGGAFTAEGSGAGEFEKHESALDMDLSGAVVGAHVIHKAFGTGTITWFDSKKQYVRVDFAKGEKKFPFPDAFVNGFLKIPEV